MKISVITPTYNDAYSIEETLQSLIQQTYPLWQWIVVNDGSTDDTKDVLIRLVNKYQISDKVILKNQENSDQQNAILNALDDVDGDYVFVLHSDDLLPSDDFFEKCVSYMQQHPHIDGLVGDLLLIDESSEVYAKQMVPNYPLEQRLLPLTLLWLGRNLLADVAFHKAHIFKNEVKKNYLYWNMPFWITYAKKEPSVLNYMKVDFPLLKYRIHQNNYIHNDLGQLNVLSGELRTAIKLMQFYTIPHYKRQCLMFRLYKHLFSKKMFPLTYQLKPTLDKYEVVKFIVKKRYPQGHLFLEAILGFYHFKGFRTLRLNALPSSLHIYYGKDGRLFFKKLQEGTLEPFYLMLLQEMKVGFTCVVVKKEDVAKMKDILFFLCIDDVFVKGA